MTTILLCLVLYGLLMFAAGLRCAVVLRERRADRRPGYLPNIVPLRGPMTPGDVPPPARPKGSVPGRITL